VVAARAQQAGVTQAGERFVVDTNVACHVDPNLASATADRVPLGSMMHVTRTVQIDGTGWYFDGWRVTSSRPVCWVYGPNTFVWDGKDPKALALEILNHALARKGAKLNDYVEAENFLLATVPGWRLPPGGIQISGLLGFRYLQVLDRALASADRNVGMGGNPLQEAWIEGHGGLVEYFEPGALWHVPASRYWTLLEANKDAVWVEELAWVAASLPIYGDECYSECLLDSVLAGPAQYWKRFPSGLHITEALGLAAPQIQQAAAGACQPGFEEDSLVHRQVVTDVRGSLSSVTSSGKGQVLKFLDDIERKCRK